MRIITTLLLLSLLAPLPAQEQPIRLTVMAWNILHGANDIPNGQEHAIEIIRAIDPDIVLMVETYGSGPRIADSLGYHFHLVAKEGTPLGDKSVNLSIYSRYPFGDRIDTNYPFYLGGREILVGAQKIRFFSNWFHYLPWENEPEKQGKSAEELLAWENTGKRYEMIQKVKPYFEKYAAETDSIPLIIGGDMNSPSHHDWGSETQAQHNGLIVPWYATQFIEDLGLIDTYRAIHPSPITHPGITWNAKDRRDEHRIDYIFYKGNTLHPIHSFSDQRYLGEPIYLDGKLIPFPSDHGFVVGVFEVRR